MGVCKPAVSGVEKGPAGPRWDDLDRLAAAIDAGESRTLIGPYRFESPLAPPVAARVDGGGWGRKGPVAAAPSIEDYLDALRAWEGRCDVLLVEGVGGLLCPLTDTQTVADLAARWGRPMLIVARLGLGTLSHTLAALEAAERRGIPVAGVLLNRDSGAPDGIAEKTNPAELRARVRAPVWGPLPYPSEEEPVPKVVAEIDWVSMLSR